MPSVIRSTFEETTQHRDSNIRILHDLQRNLLNELNQSKGLKSNFSQAPSQRPGENADILSQLELLVELVEKSQSVIDGLVGRIKNYEEIIYDLKAKLCEETAQKEAAYQQGARVQVEVRAEKDRADAAEARAKLAEDEVKSLHNREAAIHGRLSRLTAVVKNLAATSETKSPVMALAS
jgi:chromosome segregation ATPase